MDEKVDEAKQIKHHNGLFLIACARGLLSEAQKLLDMGAQPGTQDKSGLTSAHFAAAHGKKEVLSFLWSKGVELDGEDPGGRSPLHLAALGGHADCVRVLLDKGSWAEAFDAADNAALHLAARAGQLPAVEALLGAGAKTHVRNMRGLTPLGEAVVSGNLAVAKALAAAGASVGDRPRGYSLLHVAAGADQQDTVSWLLAGGTAVDDADNEEGVTPLHCAALAGSVRCARLLADRGADKSKNDNSGRTPASLVSAEQPVAKALHALFGSAGGLQATQPLAQQPAAMARKAASPAKPHEAFLAMNEADQQRRAQRWAEEIPNESAATTAALDAFDPEVRQRVVDAANIGASMNIYKALAALHQDEDFQQDLLRLPIQRVIDDTKKNPQNYEKHIQNPEIARVLEKIRRFHAVVKANGGTTVDLVQMAAGNMETVAVREQAKLTELSAGYTAHLLAVCAAARASADGETAAKSAATKAYTAEWKAYRKSSGTGSRPLPASSTARQAAPPLDDADAAADLADLANQSSMSWAGFRKDARRQGYQMLLMLLVTLGTMFVLGIGPFASSGAFGGFSPSAAGSHQTASPPAASADLGGLPPPVAAAEPYMGHPPPTAVPADMGHPEL